jgi:hypothetical protein
MDMDGMGCSQHSIIKYSFMTPFEKPFVENLFINIIKGKYGYGWDGMGCSQHSIINSQIFLYDTF